MKLLFFVVSALIFLANFRCKAESSDFIYRFFGNNCTEELDSFKNDTIMCVKNAAKITVKIPSDDGEKSTNEIISDLIKKAPLLIGAICKDVDASVDCFTAPAEWDCLDQPTSLLLNTLIDEGFVKPLRKMCHFVKTSKRIVRSDLGRCAGQMVKYPGNMTGCLDIGKFDADNVCGSIGDLVRCYENKIDHFHYRLCEKHIQIIKDAIEYLDFDVIGCPRFPVQSSSTTSSFVTVSSK